MSSGCSEAARRAGEIEAAACREAARAGKTGAGLVRSAVIDSTIDSKVHGRNVAVARRDDSEAEAAAEVEDEVGLAGRALGSAADSESRAAAGRAASASCWRIASWDNSG